MFGGTTLSHNEKWLEASVNFALDGFTGAQKLKKYPGFMKPFVARYLPAIHRIASYYAVAEEAAIPLLQNRQRTGEKAVDLLYWMADQAEGDERDLKFLAGILLKISFAAIHTSAAAPSQLIFDLCAHPEVIEPLRHELDSVCGPDGRIDKSGFHKMVKMDSIMKESQRFNPLLLSMSNIAGEGSNGDYRLTQSSVTFERIVHAPFTLSSGFTIPENTTIGIPTQAITMDPSLYPNPDKFDAFRFSTLRAAQPELDGRSQYVASNTSSMSFGYGRHACPGRFFAAQEIKAIMSFILREYDMRFSQGQTRPESFPVETQFLPNMTATVEFKRRQRN
jgi:cytochrome P450